MISQSRITMVKTLTNRAKAVQESPTTSIEATRVTQLAPDSSRPMNIQEKTMLVTTARTPLG